MLSLVSEVAGWIFLVGGSCFAIIGGLGLVRLPDFYTRIHGGGITDTLGAGGILIGLICRAGAFSETSTGAALLAFKLAMILFFLLLTSPTSAHALSKSARAHGVEPRLADEEDGSSS